MPLLLSAGERFPPSVVGISLIMLFCALIHGARSGTGNRSIALPGCLDKCGNVSIPYPFGIGHGCFLHGGLEVICDKEQACFKASNVTLRHVHLNHTFGNDSFPYPFSTTTSLVKILEINVPLGEARVQNPISWQCNYTNNTLDRRGVFFNLSLSDSLKFSDTRNKFTGIGCDTAALIKGPTNNNYQHRYVNICATFCDREDDVDHSMGCTGMGCCQSSIAGNMTGFIVGILHDQLRYIYGVQNFSPCSYAFVIEEDSFKFNPSYVKSSNFREHYADWVPLVLDWVVSNQTCVDAKMGSSYACVATKSGCVDVPNGPGYRCNCPQGYEGNPYLDEGCQDINECEMPSQYPCKGNCHNIDGSYICSCPFGSHSNDPFSIPCSQNLDNKIIIGVSISFVSLVVCVFALLIKCQKRKLQKEKERFFKQNGGQILYQKILSKQVDTVIIFSMEDIARATNNFDKSRELGTGGHATVYKGILEDNKVVAVKRSKVIDVSQTEEFIHEIVILSQVNHKNVVRLLGCCLEVEVPILVYEFIRNGTLFHMIHGNHDRPPISLEVRLKIAQESAEALEYLHLSTNCPIVHGDVKSLNILLDEDYMAKVTDFGASRMLPKNAIHLMTMVQGTLGYLDPEYLQERKLTEKSDVYSFGVVLLELITRKTAIYFEGPTEEERSLASSFLLAMREERIEKILDPSIMGTGMKELLQEVAQLAWLCLSCNGDERPSMTQVADKLKAIRSTWGEILQLNKDEETQRLFEEELSMGSFCDLSPSMYWTARMLGVDIETPNVNHRC